MTSVREARASSLRPFKISRQRSELLPTYWWYIDSEIHRLIGCAIGGITIIESVLVLIISIGSNKIDDFFESVSPDLKDVENLKGKDWQTASQMAFPYPLQKPLKIHTFYYFRYSGARPHSGPHMHKCFCNLGYKDTTRNQRTTGTRHTQRVNQSSVLITHPTLRWPIAPLNIV